MPIVIVADITNIHLPIACLILVLVSAHTIILVAIGICTQQIFEFLFVYPIYDCIVFAFDTKIDGLAKKKVHGY